MLEVVGGGNDDQPQRRSVECPSLSKQVCARRSADRVIARRTHLGPFDQYGPGTLALGRETRAIAAFEAMAADGSAAGGFEIATTTRNARRKPERVSFLRDVIHNPPIVAPAASDREGWFHCGRRRTL